MSLLFLSHPLQESTPGFAGQRGFFREHASQICCGKSSNSEKWGLSNHIGTHIDGPRHFSDEGATIDSFPAAFWVSHHPVWVDLPLEPGELLNVGPWIENIPLQCDLLLLRTGFERHRGENIYWENNPGVSPELGAWLRARRPALRFFGFDFLSLTAFQHRAAGREAHRAFLDPTRPGSPILIIEDMHLAGLTAPLSKVYLAPLLVKNSDGAPITVMAERKSP